MLCVRTVLGLPGLIEMGTVFLAKHCTTDQGLMENDPKYTQEWFDNLRRKLMEVFDGRYTQKEGAQKLINSAVIGTVVLICTSVIGAIVGLTTGLIHLP